MSWLGDHIFLTAHTPSTFDSDTIPATTFSIITRSGSVHQAQRLPEVCSPFGLNRSPPAQFFQRLRDYASLRDVILVSSTVSEDISLITRSKAPLSKDYPAEQIVDTFTSTVIALDNRRAGLPMTEDFATTSPIGMALDLSSNDAVEAPIPSDELQSSETPLPGLMALNNDGALCFWWFVYPEAIRQKAAYSGLANVTGNTTQQPQTQAMATTIPPAASAFGQPLNATSGSAFGSTFGSSAKPAFASSSPLANSGNAFGASGTLGTTSSAFGASNALGNTGSAFGAPNALGNTSSAFGAASGLGSKKSPWASQGSTQTSNTTTFGNNAADKPIFGSSNALGTPSSGPSFGNAGGLGNRQSVWGTSAATSTPTAAFGTPGGSTFSGSTFGSSTPAATFGSTTKVDSPKSSGGFASFANSGGFLTAAAQNKGENVLGKSNNTVSFDSNMDTSSSFGAATPIGAVTPKQAEQSGGLFGLGGGFKLDSGFKGDGSAKGDAPKPPSDGTNSLFGTDFGKSVDAVQKARHVPEIKEADMLSDQSDKSDNPATPDTPERTPVRQSTTPADTPAPTKFFVPPTGPPATGGLFGTQAQTKTTPAAVQTSTPTMITSKEPASNVSTPKAEDGKMVKSEPHPSESQKTDLEQIPEAPLPPEPRSKENYNSAESSESSIIDTLNAPEGEPPLPPDFVFSKNASRSGPQTSNDSASPADSPPSREVPQVDPQSPYEQALPPEQSDSDYDSGEISESEQGIDDEGSGVDVARELTPPPEASKTPEPSRGQKTRDPPRLFESPKFAPPQSGKALFGEIGSPPVLAPSRLKDQELRSPSPTRPSKGLETLRIETRPESSRSVSESVLQNRDVEKIKLGLSRTIVPHQIRKTVEEQKAEELRREEQREARRAAEEQALEDEDDLRIRQELEAPVDPTLTLAPFLSHQDYVGHIEKEGIPWQIESLYRDVNSMVDLLGLNARSLQAFILGHDREIEDEDFDSDVLDSDREWCLNDVSLLDDLEEHFSTLLQDFRLDELQAKLLRCSELHRDLLGLKKKRLEIQHTVELRKDPDHLEALRTAPLSADQATLQHDLRKTFITFQKLLADAEEQIVLLRAKLAVRGATSGPTPGFGAQKAPTVEAIQKTIAKMTSMVEKKSGDIDVLEIQMRRLKELDLGDRSSRQGTPTVGTPSRMGNGTPGSNGFFTPRSSRLGASVGSLVGTPGKGGMGVVLEETARRYEEKARKRKEVNELVKKALIKGGMRIRALDEV